MRSKTVLFCSSLLLGACLSANAQSFVPANMDFEAGNTSNWTCYRGTVASGHIYSLAVTAPVSGLHTVTSLPGTDMYGGFSVVSAGIHSLKLAHDTIDNNADAASYNLHVPSGGSYTLVYRYAAVLQDGAHPFSIQPVMEVSAVDSVTGTALPGASMVLSPTSPGFILSTTGTSVYYKPWSTGTINLSGYGGHTVIVKFTVASCGTGAHFGYGYVDVTSVFARAATESCTSATFTLSAPAGYSTYRWTDSATFTTTYGTAATASVPAPTSATTYAVIATPSGPGAADTFYTTVAPPTPPAAITGASSLTAGHTATLSDATPGGSWTSSNTAVATIGSSTGIMTGVSTGTATITYSLGGVCQVTTTVSITSALAASQISTNAKGTMSIYPNPTSGMLKIQWADQPTGAASVSIADVTGRVVSKSSLSINSASGEAQINLEGLKDGVYTISIRSDNLHYTSSLVIQK